jgi:hypothetical protein
MGEMKIDLKPDSILVKYRPYHLNPRIKEKVKKEVDKMLVAGQIFPIEEEEWIIPIVIRSNKGTQDMCGLQECEFCMCAQSISHTLQ